MQPFDRVIISANDDPRYLPFWPTVERAWQRFFPGVAVDLVKVDSPPEGMPLACYAKIARYEHAATCGNQVCLIADIDSAPLQRDFLVQLMGVRSPNHFLTYGKNYYDGTPHAGKWPAGWMTGEGHLFERMLGTGMDLRKIRVFDMKESPYLAPDIFSDESTLRALVHIAQIPCQHAHRVPDMSLWIDRSAWHVDHAKLTSGGYLEVNFLRPGADHWEQIKPVCDYIWEKDVSMEEALCVS